jgi:poly(3-hydroxybutyrate) depolymerase
VTPRSARTFFDGTWHGEGSISYRGLLRLVRPEEKLTYHSWGHWTSDHPEDCRSATAIASAKASPGPVQYITLVVDGKRRDYRLFQPPGLVNSKPIPLVIALRGTPMSSDQWESIAHFDDEAAKAGFFAAYPDGWNEAWQYSDGGSKVTDVDFIRQVFDRLETEFPIDKSRVYMVGVSAGSVMTYRLACDLSKQIAAIASVSGAMRPDTCQPAQPVSVLEMHGTNDCWTGGCPYAELLGVDASSSAGEQ